MTTSVSETYTQRNNNNARAVLVWSLLWGLSLVGAGANH